MDYPHKPLSVYQFDEHSDINFEGKSTRCISDEMDWTKRHITCAGLAELLSVDGYVGLESGFTITNQYRRSHQVMNVP